jgi:hypothetical protein
MASAIETALGELNTTIEGLGHDFDFVARGASEALDRFDSVVARLSTHVAQLAESADVFSSVPGQAPAASIVLPDETLSRMAAIEARAIAVTLQVEELRQSLAAHADALEQRYDDLSDHADAARTRATEWQTLTIEELNTSHEFVVDAFEERVTNCADSLRECSTEVAEAIEERFLNEPRDLLEAIESALRESLADSGGLLDNAAKNLSDRVSGETRALGTYVEERAKAELQARLEAVMERTLTELANDVAENALLTQVGMSLTATLSPVLPQLLVAKLTLGEIKRLLEVARMGL